MQSVNGYVVWTDENASA